MFASFIALLFYSRDYGHRAHLFTNSHAAHVTLDDFYKELTLLIDRLVETHQGRTGQPLMIPYLGANDDIATPLRVLEEHLKLAEETRTGLECANDSVIQNIIDEILGVYIRTIYKLRILR